MEAKPAIEQLIEDIQKLRGADTGTIIVPQKEALEYLSMNAATYAKHFRHPKPDYELYGSPVSL